MESGGEGLNNYLGFVTSSKVFIGGSKLFWLKTIKWKCFYNVMGTLYILIIVFVILFYFVCLIILAVRVIMGEKGKVISLIV